MLYNPAVQPLESDGYTETKKFTIVASGKAFSNLMDGLYSRKIEAVVREICTNAYDSHCAAGTPSRGFDIKIPSLWQPLFSVRDYGVGMPHAQVMDRYSTLFDSTKDQTNDQVGMLGLGSKSPFAYTDGFTLRCYDGEERRTYASYLGEGGVPEISLADISLSSEPRGAEVSFPVQRDDVKSFEDALIRVLKGFPYPPVNLPEEMRRKLVPNVRSQGVGWLLTDTNYLPSYSPVYALQGCVLYPVEIEKLDTQEDVSYTLKNMGAKLILDFDMGELEFTPGRETLSYTDHTLANLRRRWQDFRKDLNDHFDEKFSSCSTDWELAVKVSRDRLDGLFGNLFRLTDYHKRTAAVRAAMDLHEMLPHSSYQLNRIPEVDQITVVSADPQERARKTRGMNRGASFPRGPYSSGEVLWVENDPALRRPWVRLRHHLDKVGSHTAIVFNAGTKRDWSKLGNPPLLRLADLPDPPPPPKSAPTPRATWNRYGVLSDRGGSWLYVERDSSLLEGKAFVLAHNDWVVEPEHGTEAKTWRKLYPVSDLSRSRNLARAMGLPEPAVIRLRANEKYARWAKEPQFTLVTEDWVTGLSPKEIAWVINYQNWHRFKQSLYSGVMKGLQKTIVDEESCTWGSRRTIAYSYRAPKTPLDELNRFSQRYQRIPATYKTALETILKELSLRDKDHIITLGLNQGLEVLPEPCDRTGQFPWPLLPLRWEAVARMVSDSCPSELIHQSTRQILAEYAKGDPQ